jgi:hypothetical protein
MYTNRGKPPKKCPCCRKSNYFFEHTFNFENGYEIECGRESLVDDVYTYHWPIKESERIRYGKCQCENCEDYNERYDDQMIMSDRQILTYDTWDGKWYDDVGAYYKAGKLGVTLKTSK